MAPKTDPLAVVDSKLRVYGIEDLRVVDCSIMPTPISGHNTAVALMIGEKAADLVKQRKSNRNTLRVSPDLFDLKRQLDVLFIVSSVHPRYQLSTRQAKKRYDAALINTRKTNLDNQINQAQNKTKAAWHAIKSYKYQSGQYFGEFDFIVVGAGSSGSVVSTRLSEVESFKILLLEAGGWDDDLTAIPYMSLLLHKSERNWGYYTTPQKNGCYGKHV
ncbi:hypothetical protein WA026_008664 [Henosepilachna vigintioctopunctata]|uniref:Glucose-methanol-choline oxidoreductase C-terminal domain-containing protein n=1 Tax=Henosepilachna vigintioctopunctata TaxID=420089 RepID=A0AAW1UHF7_9CUCU